MDGLWTELVDATSKKGVKLNEANEEQLFNRNIEDVELWLSELEGQVSSEDFGKDLISVQNLQKKLALLESDYNAHQDRIDGISQQAQHFDVIIINFLVIISMLLFCVYLSLIFLRDIFYKRGEDYVDFF